MDDAAECFVSMVKIDIYRIVGKVESMQPSDSTKILKSAKRCSRPTLNNFSTSKNF